MDYSRFSRYSLAMAPALERPRSRRPQAEPRAAMRQRRLEAAIECLVEDARAGARMAGSDPELTV